MIHRAVLLVFLAAAAAFNGGCASAIAGRVLTPVPRADRVKWLEAERARVADAFAARFVPFAYLGQDGARLSAVMLQPQARQPRGVVVLLHGLNDSKEAMLPAAARFANAGYLAVVTDLRAHGQSEGRYTNFGYRERYDMMALLESLRSRGYDVSRVGVLGGSLGAAVAIQWAGVDHRVAAVVAIAPFAELRSTADYLYSRRGVNDATIRMVESAAEKEANFRMDQVSPLAVLASTRAAIYLARGDLDQVIPPPESERLFAAARGPAVLQRVVAGHIDIGAVLGESFAARTVDWMDYFVARDAGGRPLPSWIRQFPSRNMPGPIARR